MKKLAAAAGSLALAAACLFASSAPAQAGASSCELVLPKYFYNGANMVMWTQGLSGCAGDVEWEVESYCAEQGQWIVWMSRTSYYNNSTETIYGDLEFPDFMRVHASFDGQEKTTEPGWNNNGGGDCTPPE